MGNSRSVLAHAGAPAPAPAAEDALSALSEIRGDQPLIVDFDETLLLCNSSAEYLNSIRPYAFGRLLFHVLERLKPWRWLPAAWFGPATRDWFHLVCATLLFPWTPVLWRLQARRTAQGWGNQPLLDWIRRRRRNQVTIATDGFTFIVKPLLRHMGLADARLVGCRFLAGFVDRSAGKTERVARAIGMETIRRAAVVTDSAADQPLLDLAAKPLLARWPPPQDPPLRTTYLPFLFMLRVKHANWGHLRSVIIAEDLALLWLCLSVVSPFPLIHAGAMVLMLLSFWLVYEMGYMENDLVAERYERNPVLKSAYHDNKRLIAFREPWLWSLAAAAAGVWLLEVAMSMDGTIREIVWDGVLWKTLGEVVRGTSGAAYLKLGWWILVLLSLRLVYYVYNHRDKVTRLWLYPLLQAMRSFGFAVLSPLSVVGASAFLATVVSRWMLYAIYRYARVDWPGSEVGQVVRLFLMTALIAVLFLFGEPPEPALALKAALIQAWFSFRALKPLQIIFRNTRHVSADTWSKAALAAKSSPGKD